MSPDLIALHMGALHPFEKVLTLLLAFGPFVVLGAVIAIRRRHEDGDPEEPAGRAVRSGSDRASSRPPEVGLGPDSGASGLDDAR